MDCVALSNFTHARDVLGSPDVGDFMAEDPGSQSISLPYVLDLQHHNAYHPRLETGPRFRPVVARQ